MNYLFNGTYLRILLHDIHLEDKDAIKQRTTDINDTLLAICMSGQTRRFVA